MINRLKLLKCLSGMNYDPNKHLKSHFQMANNNSAIGKWCILLRAIRVIVSIIWQCMHLFLNIITHEMAANMLINQFKSNPIQSIQIECISTGWSYRKRNNNHTNWKWCDCRRTSQSSQLTVNIGYYVKLWITIWFCATENQIRSHRWHLFVQFVFDLIRFVYSVVFFFSFIMFSLLTELIRN